MQADLKAIQGLWEVVSTVARGSTIGSCTTHYQFEGNRVKEIDPSMVDGGEWCSFELNTRTRPKRFTMTTERAGRGGEIHRRVDRWAYELDGDALRLCWPSIFGRYPDTISSETHGVVTLKRYSGPAPATKRPSGKQSVSNRLLGQLSWNDNYDWWDGEVGLRAQLHIKPGTRGDELAIRDAVTFVRWFKQHEPAARRYAASQLLDLHNESWSNSAPISARTFANRMTLETIAIENDRSAELYYRDGNLFYGHCIIVRLGAARKFRGADIAG